MIDISDKVFAIIYDNIMAATAKEKIPLCEVRDAYSTVVSRLPLVVIEEIDNTTTSHIIGFRTNENYASIVYEVTVYANEYDSGKKVCKEIMSIINDALISNNFDRTFLRFIHNYNDPTIKQLKARFKTVADSENRLYRR